MRVHALILGAALLLGLALTACQQPAPTPTPTTAPTATRVPTAPTPTTAPAATPKVAPATGTVEVRVTDAPPEGVSRVLVTASKIEAQRSDASGESGWTTIVEAPPVFDLVAVTGLEEVLGQNTLAARSYGQVRLAVTKVVVTIQGKDQEAEVPSDKLRVVGGFQVAAGQTTVLTLDFDADKSVVLAGPRVQFKPVVKLLVKAPTDKPEAPKKKVVVHLTGIGTAPQSGEAVITAAGDKTEVVINVKPGPAGVAQPAHIHDTECQLPPKVTYPLTNVVDGKSTTVVNTTLASLQAKPFAFCVHLSVPEITTYVAAGHIPRADAPRATAALIHVPLTGIGAAAQSGEAVLTAAADKTLVFLHVKPGPAGVAQPAHIHDTECQLPPKVTYPLSNVVDGKSSTVVNTTLASLQAKPFAICVHLSVPEITTYVAAGPIPFTGAAASAPTPTVAGGPAPTPTKAPAAATPTTFQVSIKDITLLNITIPVSTTLTWANGDTVSHILGSGKNGKFDAGGWKSATLNPGQSFSQVFNSTGTFAYTCSVHPTLNATVTVAQAGTPTSSTPASSGGSDYY